MRIGKQDYDGGQGDEAREQPEAGEIQQAVIGCIESVGWQASAGYPAKQKVVVGFELAWKDSKGRREVLFLKYYLSLWKKADGSKASSLRALLDLLAPDADNSEADTDDFVGRPCRVLVGHDGKGRAKIEKVLPPKGTPITPERDYAQPFGLWAWLLKNQAPAPTQGDGA